MIRRRPRAVDVDRYERDGFLIVPGFLATEARRVLIADLSWLVGCQLELHGAGIETVYADEVWNLSHNLIRLDQVQSGGQGIIYDEVNRLPTMFQLAADSRLLTAAKTLLSDRIAIHPRLNMIMSMPGDQRQLATWHQDGFYGQANHLVAYIPLQPTAAHNGGLIVAVGEHRRGLLPHAQHDDWGVATKFLTLEPETVDSFADRRQLELEAGDLLLFDRFLPHSARVNQSPHVRFAITIRYSDLTDPYFVARGWQWRDLCEQGLSALASGRPEATAPETRN